MSLEAYDRSIGELLNNNILELKQLDHSKDAAIYK